MQGENDFQCWASLLLDFFYYFWFRIWEISTKRTVNRLMVNFKFKALKELKICYESLFFLASDQATCVTEFLWRDKENSNTRRLIRIVCNNPRLSVCFFELAVQSTYCNLRSCFLKCSTMNICKSSAFFCCCQEFLDFSLFSIFVHSFCNLINKIKWKLDESKMWI